MNEVLDALFLRTWWRWSPESADWFSRIYRWFNPCEAAVWFAFAWMVARRHWRFRRGGAMEVWYAVGFFGFGLTDVREAWAQQSWLIWVKAINLLALLALLALRRVVIRRYYPGSWLY